MSTLLVALIVFATFSGFDVVNRVSADQRRHDQAAVLAAQSQEEMRSDPASVLTALQTTPHEYTQTASGTTFTITQTAKFVNDTKPSAECSATGAAESSSKQNSDYLQITSSVTWAALSAAKRPPVVQSGIITPPTGSGLEVDALNGGSPEEPVAGLKSVVKYTAVEAEGPTTVEGTTGAAGCSVFGGIPATTAKVEATPPLGYVTLAGSIKLPEAEVTIAPNITTHKIYTVAEGGAVKAEFLWKELSSFEGKEVKGETFVAFNNKTLVAPYFILGNAGSPGAFEYEGGGEERYTAQLNKPAAVGTTPKGVNYPKGDLFPFPGTGKWLVYAGDCPKNNVAETANPEKLKEGEQVLIEPGKTATVKVALSYVTLNIYKGTSAKPETLSAEALPVRITDTECEASGTPLNAKKLLVAHEQKSTTTGHLENPFQPFGKYSLCVYSAKEKANYTVKYTNETQAGSTRNIYLKSPTIGEQTVTSNPVEPC